MDRTKQAQEKARGKNFKESEIQVLLDLVEKHKDVIESKKSDVVSSKDKEAAWETIETQFNSLSSTYFPDARTLRSKYDNLKKTTKRRYADDKKYVMVTGGGPYVKRELTEMDARVKCILGDLQVLGHTSRFDSDAFEVPQQKIEFVVPQPEIEFVNNQSWDINNVEVFTEEEVGLTEELEVPAKFTGSFPPCPEISKPALELNMPTSSGQFNVQESPRKVNPVPPKGKPIPRKAITPFQLRDLKTKISSPLQSRKAKSVIDSSVVGKKIEEVGKAKKEVMDLQKELYEKQIQILDEEHRQKIQFLEEEHRMKTLFFEQEHVKKQRLLDLKIEKEEYELLLLKRSK